MDRSGLARPRRRPGRPVPARPRRPARHERHRRGAAIDPVHDAVREHLHRRGASFFPQLRAAVGRRAATRSCSTRSGTSSGPARSRTTPLPRCAPCAPTVTLQGRPSTGTGRLARTAAGSGSLVARRRPRRRGAHAHRTRPCPGGDAPRSARRRDARGGCRPRGSAAATHRSIRCCERWRSPAERGVAISSRASERRSSRCRGRWTASAPCASTIQRSWSWPPPTQLSRMARRSSGREAPMTSACPSSGRPARTSSSSTGEAASTSSAAVGAW